MPNLTGAANKAYTNLMSSIYKNTAPSPLVQGMQTAVSGLNLPTLKSSYSGSAPVSVSQPTQPAITPDQAIADSIAKQIKTWNKFTEVLPYETIVNEDLLRQFGLSQANPEANRLKWTGMYNNLVNQSRAGNLNSGLAQQQRYDLGNQYERQRQELANQFYQAANARMGDYYNELYKEYYTDPNAFQYNPVPLADVIKKSAPSMPNITGGI